MTDIASTTFLAGFVSGIGVSLMVIGAVELANYRAEKRRRDKLVEQSADELCTRGWRDAT
jgi:hypothetical protein